MKPRVFIIILLSIIIVLSAGVALLSSRHEIEGAPLAYAGIIVFSALCIAFYFLTRFLSLRSAEKAYLNVIFLNFMVKFFIVILIPLVFYLQNEPMTSNFILPYVVVYIVFTVFETSFLSKNVRMRK